MHGLPEIRLSCKLSAVASFVRWPSSVGRLPEIRLPLRFSSLVSAVSIPNSVGMVPDSRSLDRSRSCKLPPSPSHAGGSVPLIRLFFSHSVSMLGLLPSTAGSVPLSFGPVPKGT